MTDVQLTVELADRNGTPVAVLEHVNDLKVLGARNRPTIVTGDLFVPRERFAAASWEEGKSRLRVYLGDDLIAHTLVGPCTDDVGKSENIKFTSADPLTMPLGRRRVQSDVTYTTQDKGAIVKARIDAQNTRSDTFIGTSAYSFTTGNTITAEYEKGKPETEIIGELCNSLNGIDFQIMPVAVNGDPQMGEARVWANRGSVLTNIAFETGQNGKKNVESFTVVVDPMKVTTDERVTGKEDAESEDQNTDTLDDFGTILDSLDALSDISSQALLDAVRDQLLAWRSTSRRVVTFKPTGSAYLPVRDFNVADYVPVHLEGGRWVGERVITGAVRVHGWELTRDAGGAARLSSVTILPEDQGGA